MKTPPKHPLTVEGYEDKLSLLAERIHRMRYDKVAQFYKDSGNELLKQASNDKKKGRVQLAALLEESVRLSAEQEALLKRIWKLCKPHMKKGD